MDIQSRVTSFNYQIERTPGGGYVARSSDPAVPSIEAATYEELTQKIRAATMSSAVSGLKLPTNLEQSTLEVAIESLPQSTIVIKTNKGAPHAASQEEIEQFAGLLGKKFPQLSQELAARIVSAKAAANAAPTTTSGAVDVVSNAPIVPERSSARIFGILIGLLALATFIYFVLYR